jgi:hypothetical protein
MATIIVIVIVLVVLAVAAGLAATVLRRRALRQRFGPEYDQLAQEVGPRRASAELAERQRRVAKLDLRPLSPERRAGYDRQWASLQDGFVDGPAQAVESAAALVSAVAGDRGYPAGDDDELLADLSVHHADRLDAYRGARETTGRAGTASTEELRRALLGYRALFRDLLGMPEPEAGPEPAPAAPAASGTAGPAAADPAGGVTGVEPATEEAGDTGEADTGEAVLAARDEADDGETLADSGRDDRAAAAAARKE